MTHSILAIAIAVLIVFIVLPALARVVWSALDRNAYFDDPTT